MGSRYSRNENASMNNIRELSNTVSHVVYLKMADEEGEPVALTTFTPYDDAPQGALSKLSSFLSKWTRPSRSDPVAAPPETQHAPTLTSSAAERYSGAHYTSTSSGQMSVQSVPPKNQSMGGVSAKKLRKALIQSIKSEGDETDKVLVFSSSVPCLSDSVVLS